jgi:enamine deaminase RidA (YjgF/YER057c/UK114 family)
LKSREGDDDHSGPDRHSSQSSGTCRSVGDHRPASTVIVAGLANPAWKIEIEGIACA